MPALLGLNIIAISLLDIHNMTLAVNKKSIEKTLIIFL